MEATHLQEMKMMAFSYLLSFGGFPSFWEGFLPEAFGSVSSVEHCCFVQKATS